MEANTAQGIPMAPEHRQHPVSSEIIPTSSPNPAVAMPSLPAQQIQNTFMHLPVSMATSNLVHGNMPPLDAMKMERIAMPNGPSIGMATDQSITVATGQGGANMENKTLLKHAQGGAAKDIPVEDLEFDGNTVLCRVCGDKASGFHYGVHACEGCKGFFRRSIQQKIQYRPCLKNQMCNIMRVNRNRCQYCRLRKCIAVGMSRDAVRFGRVPKREKAKILEQMQKVNAQLQGSLLNDALGDPSDVTDRVIAAHTQYCDFTRSRFAELFEKAWEKPQFVDCPAHMACPLSPAPDQSEGMQKWDEFSNCFTPAIRNVVNFAKSIPGFNVFSQEDQVTLLKAGTFEVLLVHLACLFDTQTNTMMFTNGKLYRKLPQQGNTSAGFLLDSMFDFADRINQLRLTDHEVALFSSLVITAPDRPGLRYLDQVQKVHSVLSHSLQKMMVINHPEEPAAFSKLLMKLPDLRTLNTLHSEKLLGLTVPQNGSSQTGDEVEQVLPPSGVTSNQEVPMQPKSEPCPVRSKSPSYNDHTPRPGHYPMVPYQQPIMRCPISEADRPTLGGLPPQFLSGPRPPVCPIVPHQVPIDPKDKELILQTPFGSFHRQTVLPYAQFDPAMAAMMNMGDELNSAAGRKLDNPLNHASPMVTVPKTTNIPEQNLKSSIADNSASVNQQYKSTTCSSPEDFIDIDFQHSKAAGQKPDLRQMLGKLDVRRMMLDPSMPEAYRKRLLESIDPTMSEGSRKRLLESIECEVDPKIAKLWEYDMRSSRSNSLSSSSSMESTDSAYRTISNPGTPRSHYEMVRSPYTNPADVSSRLSSHTVTTQSTLPRVTEEKIEGQEQLKNDDSEKPTSEGPSLPTLRKMLLAAQTDGAGKESGEQSGNKRNDSESTDDAASMYNSPDQHYFIHKKLKMKQSLNLHKDSGEFRMRAASFSTVVSKMRPHMAPPFMKPRSVEAPPRLTTKSPTKVTMDPSDTPEKVSSDAAKMEDEDGTTGSIKPANITATATFAAIISRVMEAALSRDDDDDSSQQGDIQEQTIHDAPTVSTKVSECADQPPIISDVSPAVIDDSASTRVSNNTTGEDPSKVTAISIPVSTTGQKVIASSAPSNAGSLLSVPVLTKHMPTKPSERHPELMSRLTSGPKLNGLPSHCNMAGRWSEMRSRTPPPRLYPVQDTMHGCGPYTEHSPPSLQPVTQHRPRSNTIQSIMRHGSPDISGKSHLTAISSLKDKILKRIDSQENLTLSPQHVPWAGSAHSEQQHLTSHHTAVQNKPCKPQPTGAHITPEGASRKHSHPSYRCSPKSGTPSSSPPNIPGNQHAMSQYPLANGSVPMPLPPNSVGFFPGGHLPANMHPALLFNSAVQFQALQQLHVQAASIQHQMAHISNMAAMNTVNPAAMESIMTKVNHNGEDRRDNRHLSTMPHSQHLTNYRLGDEPVNLTKDPSNIRSLSNIKPEPL